MKVIPNGPTPSPNFEAPTHSFEILYLGRKNSPLDRRIKFFRQRLRNTNKSQLLKINTVASGLTMFVLNALLSIFQLDFLLCVWVWYTLYTHYHPLSYPHYLLSVIVVLLFRWFVIVLYSTCPTPAQGTKNNWQCQVPC